MRFMFLLFGGLMPFMVASMAQAEEKAIDGWGKLKFGMTHAEVRSAAPLLDIVILDNEKPWGKDAGKRGYSKNPAIIAGLPFEVKTSFFLENGHVDGWLQSINLSSEGKGITAEACKARFTEALYMLEQTYGAFHPPRGWPEKQVKAPAGTPEKLAKGDSIFHFYHSKFDDFNTPENSRNSTIYRAEYGYNRATSSGRSSLNIYGDWDYSMGANKCVLSVSYLAPQLPQTEKTPEVKDSHGF